MSLPSMLTFNELDGTEVRELMRNRWSQILDAVPYLQKHITFPHVRVTLQAKIEIWADQPTPDLVPINDRFDLVVERETEPTDVFDAQTVDSTAPEPGGQPPDEVRDRHGLPITQPARGPRDVGGQVVISDQPVQLDGREVQGMPGLKISRTGSGVIDGMATSENATIMKIDQGPAGLRSGNMNRDRWSFGGKK